MAITTGICNSWVRDAFIGAFDHTASTGHTFRCPLYSSSATLSKSTTAYSNTNELANGNGYTTKGAAIASVTPVLSGDTLVFDFADMSLSSFTTADVRGFEIFDDTHASDASVMVYDFGATNSVTAGTLTIVFPAATAATAIITL